MGNTVFDALLDGGYEAGIITTIYGPAGSGKTTACLLAAIDAAKTGKVIFIDTEGGFSAARWGQLCADKKRIHHLLLLQPKTFEEQKQAMEKLRTLASGKIGLIVCDTISALYRTERGEDNAGLNRELSKQVGILLEIARSRSIPVIMTNQVYASFDEKASVHMVGGDIVKYSSKCIIEMQSLAGSVRRAILRKHRHLPEKSVTFSIVQEGFEER